MKTLTLNLDDRHMAVLDALATEQGMTTSQVMVQALRLYQLVHERGKAGHRPVFMKDGEVVPDLTPNPLPPVA